MLQRTLFKSVSFLGRLGYRRSLTLVRPTKHVTYRRLGYRRSFTPARPMRHVTYRSLDWNTSCLESPRAATHFFVLCSVKANGGHAEPAAGMSGLLRLCVGLRASTAPPNGQLHTINPHVDAALREEACALPTQRSAAPACGARAGGGCAGGVSSFGYSGTIAHAVLDSGVVGGELRASAASWSAGPRYNRRSFRWCLPAPRGAPLPRFASFRRPRPAWLPSMRTSAPRTGAGGY